MKWNKEEWEKVELGKLAKIGSGGTPSRSERSYYNGEIPWAKISDIEKAVDRVILETDEQITREGLANIRNKVFPKGTLLFAMYGSVGKTAFTGSEMSTNQAILGIESYGDLDLEYLNYWFVENKERLLASARGVALKNLSAGIIRKTQIPLPPLSVQKEIAELLDTADALRQKTQAQLDALDELAQSVFLEMFGDPVTNEKGWEVKKLGSFGEWKSGGTPSRSKNEYFDKGNINWFSSGELNSMHLKGTIEKITEDAIKESNTKDIPIGSLLLGMYDTAALKSGITTERSTCNQAIAYCLLDFKQINTVFCYSYVQIAKDWLKRLQRGVRQKNLNLSMIKGLKIFYPPLTLQNQFAAIIENIETQKASLKASLQESEDLFGCLLQEVFG